MTTNPFRPDLAPAERGDADLLRWEAFPWAASLWDIFADLPNKAEATLAQRRLEEAMFWAERAV